MVNATVKCVKRILVLDDDPLIAQIVGESLELAGYSVEIYSDPLAALAAFQNNSDSYDAVVTDQTMPHLTGIQLAEKVRAIRGDIPIVLCTGFSDKVDASNYTTFGVSHFVSKPIDFQSLLEVMAGVISG